MNGGLCHLVSIQIKLFRISGHTDKFKPRPSDDDNATTCLGHGDFPECFISRVGEEETSRFFKPEYQIGRRAIDGHAAWPIHKWSPLSDKKTKKHWSMLAWCWSTLCNAGPASGQHRVNASCQLGQLLTWLGLCLPLIIIRIDNLNSTSTCLLSTAA